VTRSAGLLTGGAWVVGHFTWDVCGTGHCEVLPGKEEDDSTIAGGRVKLTHLCWAVMQFNNITTK